MFFLLPTWFLVFLGLLIVLCLPFWIVGEIMKSVRRREQAAMSARNREANLAREVRRMELLEEHRTLLNDMHKRSDELAAPFWRKVKEQVRQVEEGASPKFEIQTLQERADERRKMAMIKRPEKLSSHADGLLGTQGWPDWKCVWTKTVSRAECDRDFHFVRMNFEAYADKTDSEFEADVLALIRQLNSESILKVVKEGLSEVEILWRIKSHSVIYSLGIDQTIALKRAGVSDKVLAAMAAASALAENTPFMWAGRT